MSYDGEVPLETCIAVTRNHGATVVTQVGVVAFSISDEVAVRLPNETPYTKSVVRKLQRAFDIPIFHFYNPDNCKPGCEVRDKRPGKKT